jgi:lysophospholipase L1-like esterase
MPLNLESIEIHNAVPVFNESQQGWELPRYPRAVREVINTSARTISGKTTGVELRFVSSGPEFCLTVRTLGDPASITVRKGAFWVQQLDLGPGQTRRVLIRRPGTNGVRKDILRGGGWSPDVWRIQFDGSDSLLQDIDPLGWEIRPPKAEEKPSLKWLAYGSSITNADDHGYPFVAAQLLHADVLNKGLSGSCHIEPEIADWFAILEFDLATLELGINMRDQFEPEEFEKRARYLVQRLCESHPQAHLVLLTHFLNRDHHPEGEPTRAGQRQQAFDAILRRIHADSRDPHLHLIEGTEILTDFHLLAADMIHPTHEGQAQMGVNLSERLKDVLQI